MKQLSASIRPFVVFVSLFLVDFGAIVAVYFSLPRTSHLSEDHEIHRQRFLGGPHELSIQIGGENYIRYPEIPPTLIASILLLEDSRFFEHHGIDLRELKKVLSQIGKEKRLRGASTVTQQLARILFLSGEREFSRKFMEALISLKLEFDLPKWRILELYINSIDWGESLIGVEKASQHYFDRPTSDLSVFQSVYLAALIPNPVLYSRDPSQRRFQNNINIALERLLRNEEIDLESYRRALNEKLVWEKKLSEN